MELPIFVESLTSSKYLEILTSADSEFLENIGLEEYQDCWFQVDGTPP